MEPNSKFVENDRTVLSSLSIWKCSHKDKMCIDLAEKNKNKNHYLNKMKAVNLKGYKYFLLFPTEVDRINLIILPEADVNTAITYKKIKESEYRNISKDFSFRTLGRPSECYLFNVGKTPVGIICLRTVLGCIEILNIFNISDRDYKRKMIKKLLNEIHSGKKFIYHLNRRIETPDLFIENGFVIKDIKPPRWYLVEGNNIIRNTNCYIGEKFWDCGYIKMELNSSP